jgi:nucleoside-diphosphate-sugar epimerase
MRVLVTGAGGFAGGHAARRLASAGHDVVALTRRSAVEPPAEPAAARRFRVATGAIEDRTALPRDIDAIVHAAATSIWGGVSVDRMVTDNVLATQALVRHAQAVGVRTFVLLSSVSAFGTISAPLLSEAAPCVDPDAYGATKLLGEQMLADTGPGLSSLAIRLPAVIGRGSKRNWPSECLRKLQAGEPLAYFNPDAPFNNVVHEADLSALVEAALARPPAGHEMVLAASAGSIRIAEAVDILVAATKSRSAVSSTTSARRAFLIDTTKAQRLFGFAPMPVAQALRRFAGDDAPAGRSASNA